MLTDHKALDSSKAALLRKAWAEVHICGFEGFFSLAPRGASPQLLLYTLLPTAPFVSFQLFWPRASAFLFFLLPPLSTLTSALLHFSWARFLPSIGYLSSVETPYPFLPCLNSVCACLWACVFVEMQLLYTTACCSHFPTHPVSQSQTNTQEQNHAHLSSYALWQGRSVLYHTEGYVCVSDCSCFWPSRLPPRFQLHFPP